MLVDVNYIETESENWNFLKYGRIGKHPMQSLYVTRSGKRYNSAQKFKMELFIAPHCALRAVYDDVSRSILAFSVLEL